MGHLGERGRICVCCRRGTRGVGERWGSLHQSLVQRHARNRAGHGVGGHSQYTWFTDHGFGSDGGPVRQENGLHSINISLHALPLCLAGGEEVSDVVLGKEKVSATAQFAGAGSGRDEQDPSRRGASQTRRAQTLSSRLGCWGRRCAGCLGGWSGRGRGLGFGGGTVGCSISTGTCHSWVGGPYMVQTQRRPEAGSGSACRMRAQQSPRRRGQDGAHGQRLSLSTKTLGSDRASSLQLTVPDASSAHNEHCLCEVKLLESPKIWRLQR